MKDAKIGGLTGYDINLPISVKPSNLRIITDSDNHILSAFDICYYLYQKVKDVKIFKTMCSDFFFLFEIAEQMTDMACNEVSERKR